MRWSSTFSLAIATLASLLLPFASAERILESNSLATCMTNSSFYANHFNVKFTADTGVLNFNITGMSEISGDVILEITVLGYGYTVYHNNINPCNDEALSGLCPMNQGIIPNLNSNTHLDKNTISEVPAAIYYIPDIDGTVIVQINNFTTGQPLACVMAQLTNEKTVNQKAVAWFVAVVAGLALAVSAITSGLGHSNTAAHVAANALALFGYFQAQAFIGMTAITSPPIVRAWTQNFQWSMGIIHVGFLQKMALWYQRATGGIPTTYLANLGTTSVYVQKRSLEYAGRAARRMMRRALTSTPDVGPQTITVKGIDRVGFVSNIEASNIFFTGYVFLVIFVLFVCLGVAAFKYICDWLVKSKKLKPDQFHEFRNGWTLVLKGILFRIVLIAFPQMVVLCFWEMTVRDSAALVVLAVATIFTMIGLLGWASLKVWRIARRSISLHKNPAYILYSDPKALNKWGFLYVQFRASMYYFIAVVLGYLLVKGLFIAFGQKNGVVQAVGLVIVEAAFLITISVMRPYMDGKTNAFNISIASINLFNVLLLLFFSGIFSLPALAIGIMGVLYFIVNCVFAIVILIMCGWASVRALMTKNPDSRYQPMRDDRGSFIKSNTNLGHTELDALGATARGDENNYMTENKRMDLEHDNNSSLSTLPPRAGTHSPYDSGYSTPHGGGNYARPPQPIRAASPVQRSASPANAMWQRGVGY